MGKRLIVATTNPGKVRQIAGALAATDMECVAISSVLERLPEVTEVGSTAAAVSAAKARAYSDALNDSVVSMDHWLFFDEVPASEQPGAHVRRIPGRPAGASDDELLDYYAGLSQRHGGRLTARWSLGVAVAGPRGVLATTAEAIRFLIDVPSPTRVPGLPLSALQIDPDTGKYISEHTGEEEERLWQRVYGPSIAEFVPHAITRVA